MKLNVVLCGIFVVMLMGCESITEQQREEIVREARQAGGVIPPDLMPPPRVINSFTGIRSGRVAGNLVGIFSQATADPELRISEVLGGRESAGAHDYRPTDGIRLIIERVYIEPMIASPGKYLDLSIRYVLLSPVQDSWTEITEVRELFFNGEFIGRPEAHLSVVDGTYTTTVRIQLPAYVPPGEYQLVSTVETDYAIDAEEIRFLILNGH